MPDYRLAARRAAVRYGLDPAIFERQINAESGFNPNADSSAGARGIAQFMPGTAASNGVNLNDGRVTDDLNGAARLMAGYVKKYGSYRNALIAYNAGPGRVGKPLFAETAAYVAKILNGSDPKGLSSAPAATTRKVPSSQGSPKMTTTTQTTPGTDNRALRAAAIQTFLGRSHQDPLQFALNIRNLQDVPPASSSTRAAAPPAAPGASSSGPAVPGAAGAAVDFARSRIGAYSESAGSNRGPHLDKLEARFGFPGSGQPWCAMFTSVVVTRGGAPKAARTASVDEIRRQVNAGGAGYQHGFVQKARPGDLILFGNEHVAFVEGVGPGGEIHAISGNGRTGKVARVTYAAGSGDIARPLYTRPLK